MVSEGKQHKPFRALSLDGGGMRGLYTAAVLNSLSERFGNGSALDIGKGFDLISGTSTGAILATAIASGVPVKEVIKLYKDQGPTIFSNPIPQTKFKKIMWGLGNLSKPANGNENLSSALTNIFKTETIGELFNRRKIPLCVASVNIATHKPRVFKTSHDPEKSADDQRLLRDICLATSAAPIILPIAGVPDPLTDGELSHFVDGGLWANNPILITLVEALSIAEPDQEIQIISIGTCPPPSGSSLIPKEANRGIVDWSFGLKALELSMDAQASGSLFIANFLASSLSKLGKKIKIIRLDQSSPSAEQANLLSLDNASQKACSTLIQLGHSDGLEIYGKATRQDGDYKTLEQIFKNIPKFHSEDK
ncbi:CBASS cGAMP-activated phospholipase [Halobacteriovorax sp. HLS]|uniref:CBASS cGAMP-activated phospholipase n=1 Tax=Halobacteriovorax sp. HLS TaxID=2234000 RepID=UPI000FD8BFB2|nr:CBASS cGAMP-activated phospholipase [Halobacteriovorax sp. HLS]